MVRLVILETNFQAQKKLPKSRRKVKGLPMSAILNLQAAEPVGRGGGCKRHKEEPRGGSIVGYFSIERIQVMMKFS